MKTALSNKILAAMILLSATASVVSTVIAQVTYEPTATITVTSSADAGGICPGPTCTLRQAIATAAAGNTIDFAAGITTITLTSAELLIDKNLTIRGPGADVLAVERNPNASLFRIFRVTPGHIVTMEGLTVSNGHPQDSIDSGGGVYNDHATLTLNGCAFSENVANYRGGAIYNDGNNGNASLTVNNCVFDHNSAANGGALFNGGSGGTTSLVINDSTVSGNFTRPMTGGGGILNFVDAQELPF